MVFLLVLAVAVLPIAIYLPSISYPLLFTEKHIVAAARAHQASRNLDPQHHKTVWYWISYLRYHDRPLTWWTYEIDGRRWGFQRAIGWRCTNIGLHAIASVLVFVFIRELGCGNAGGAIAAGIYAASPVNSAAVCSLTARAGLLCACFYLLSLITLLDHHFIASVLFAGMAWKSKEDAITLPFVGAALWWLQS